MIAVTSMAQLAALRSKLLELPEVTAKIAARAATELTKLAQEDFDAKRSPYGDPWGVGDQGQTIDLNKTGALRGKAIAYQAVGRVVRVSIAMVKYSRYQIKRGILPRAGALPARYADRIKQVADDALREATRA